MFCYKTSFSQAFAFATVLTASRSFCVHLATEKKEEEEVVIFFFFLLLCNDFFLLLMLMLLLMLGMMVNEILNFFLTFLFVF